MWKFVLLKWYRLWSPICLPETSQYNFFCSLFSFRWATTERWEWSFFGYSGASRIYFCIIYLYIYSLFKFFLNSDFQRVLDYAIFYLSLQIYGFVLHLLALYCSFCCFVSCSWTYRMNLLKVALRLSNGIPPNKIFYSRTIFHCAKCHWLWMFPSWCDTIRQ